MTILEAALEMAARGYRVFPLTCGGKDPLPGTHGVKDATTNTATIRQWFEGNPGYNYGVAAGSGLLVLDLDKKSGGLEYEAKLEGMGVGGWGDSTFTVRTPGGGLHLYFKGPDVANSVGKIAPGVDIRSEGGYVVGPGSVFSDPGGRKGYKGNYVIEDPSSPLEVPQEIVLRAGERRERDTLTVAVDEPCDIAAATRWLQCSAPVSVEGQGGNDTAYRVATRLRELGCSPETSLEIMLEHWNDRCIPPWDVSELETFCQNADLYGQNATGSKGVTAMAEEGGPIDESLLIEEPVLPPPTEPEKGSFYKIWKDLRQKCRTPPLEQVKDERRVMGSLAQRGEVTVLAGPPGTGKSAFLIGAAACGAVGKEFSGFQPDEPFKTVIYNGEDSPDTLYKRIHGACEANGIAWSDTVDSLQCITGKDRRLKIVGADGVLTNEAKELAQLLRDENVAMFVVDTLSRVHNVEENSSHLMSAVMESLGDFATLADCAVLLTHHTTKRTGVSDGADAIRGASAIVGSARAAFTLFSVSNDEARAQGLATDSGRRYVRLDEAKQNNSKWQEGSIWLEKKEHILLDGRSTVVHERVNVNVSGEAEAQLIVETLAGTMTEAAEHNIRSYDAAKYLSDSDTYLKSESKTRSDIEKLRTKIHARLAGKSLIASNGDKISLVLRGEQDRKEYWIVREPPEPAPKSIVSASPGEWDDDTFDGGSGDTGYVADSGDSDDWGL